MENENTANFEKWVADEMGHTTTYIAQRRKQNAVGGVYYDHEEIHKRYRAWCAGFRNKAGIPGW